MRRLQAWRLLRLHRQVWRRRVRAYAGGHPEEERRERGGMPVRPARPHRPGLRHSQVQRRARVHVLPQPVGRHAPDGGGAEPGPDPQRPHLPLRLHLAHHGAVPLGPRGRHARRQGRRAPLLVRPQRAPPAVALGAGGPRRHHEHLEGCRLHQGERRGGGLPHPGRRQRREERAVSLVRGAQAARGHRRREGLQVLHQGLQGLHARVRCQDRRHHRRRRRLRRLAPRQRRQGRLHLLQRGEAEEGTGVLERVRGHLHHPEGSHPGAANHRRRPGAHQQGQQLSVSVVMSRPRG